jgi:hypothetical protein
VPIVFARAGGALWSPIDGKLKAGGGLARVRNIERDPRVALLLDHYADGSSSGGSASTVARRSAVPIPMPKRRCARSIRSIATCRSSPASRGCCASIPSAS